MKNIWLKLSLLVSDTIGFAVLCLVMFIGLASLIQYSESLLAIVLAAIVLIPATAVSGYHLVRDARSTLRAIH